MLYLNILLGVLASFFIVDSRTAPERTKRFTKCYGVLGCFTSSGPWTSSHRPVNFIPSSPSHIKTRFLLYTRRNPTREEVLDVDDFSTISRSHFDVHKPTKMVSHGFLENGMVEWMRHMKDELLKKGDFNVINIDWGGGSSLPYTQATANTRVVGAVVALLIKHLKDNLGADPRTFHIIGHSLGAHIAGYAGERTPNLGRITGLDPAGPYYENTDPVVRLDPTDALFVDNIHTNGENLLKLGYGMLEPCGHVDYYPNGGEEQPGCDKDPVSDVVLEGGLYNGVKQFVACNHLRAYDYFSESVNSVCPFEAYHCSDYDNFKTGRCIPCSRNDCGHMGYNADQSKPRNGQTHVKYYLMTGAAKPFCRYHYTLNIMMEPGAKTERGSLFIKLIGNADHTDEIRLSDEDKEFEGGETYNFIAISDHAIGGIRDVDLKFIHNSKWYNPLEWNPFNMRHPKLYVREVDVIDGETSARARLCSRGTALENGVYTLLNAC